MGYPMPTLLLFLPLLGSLALLAIGARAYSDIEPQVKGWNDHESRRDLNVGL